MCAYSVHIHINCWQGFLWGSHCVKCNMLQSRVKSQTVDNVLLLITPKQLNSSTLPSSPSSLATLKSHRDWQAWGRLALRCHQRLTGRTDIDLCFKAVQNSLSELTQMVIKITWKPALLVVSVSSCVCLLAFVSQSMSLCLNHKLKT